MPRKKSECYAGHEAFVEKLAVWEAEFWEASCRLMQVNLMNGNILRARQALDAYCRERVPGFLHLDRFVTEVLPPKWAEIFWEAGYCTMRSLYQATDQELLQLGEIGEKTVLKIRQICLAIINHQVPDIGLFDEADTQYDQPCRGHTKEQLEKELEYLKWKQQLIEQRLAKMAEPKKRQYSTVRRKQ